MNSPVENKPVMVPLYDPMPVVPRPRLYMPRTSGISQWCEKLGRCHRDYYPDVSIYNTGFHLFCVEGHPPYIRFTAEMLWRWIKFEEYNPIKQPDHTLRHLGRRCTSFDLHGHDEKTLAASITVTVRTAQVETHFMVLPACHILHIVNGPFGKVSLAIEPRILPAGLFQKAFLEGKLSALCQRL